MPSTTPSFLQQISPAFGGKWNELKKQKHMNDKIALNELTLNDLKDHLSQTLILFSLHRSLDSRIQSWGAMVKMKGLVEATRGDSLSLSSCLPSRINCRKCTVVSSLGQKLGKSCPNFLKEARLWEKKWVRQGELVEGRESAEGSWTWGLSGW